MTAKLMKIILKSSLERTGELMLELLPSTGDQVQSKKKKARYMSVHNMSRLNLKQ
jgi:hypothetical protein